MSEIRKLVESGVAALKADTLHDALRVLSTALQRAPHDAAIQSLYGLALVRAGRSEEAGPILVRAVEAEPDQMGFRLNLSEYYERTGRDAEAAGVLRLIAAREPNFRPAWERLVGALTRSRSWRDLAAAGEAWLRTAPNNDDALNAIARAKYELGDFVGAQQAYGVRRRTNPHSSEAQCSYGLCCLAAGDFDEAAAALDEAERLDPNDLDMLEGRARLLTYLGRFAEAEAYCRRCLSLDPERVQAYTFLSQLTKGRLSEKEKQILTRLADQQGGALNQRIPAAFALARAHHAEDDIDAAFASYSRANELCFERARAEGVSYDPAQAEARAERIMTRAAQPTAPREASEGPTPIFIVGMPRSGTTLVEGVLSAHSKVCGKGELSAMRFVLQNWLNAPHADAAQMEAWARTYLDAAGPVNEAAFFTDKMPMNFEAVALVARLFPASPIIHVRRNALETGFSIFRQSLSKFVTFANRLEDIAHAYGQYAQLIAHWRRALGDRVTTIQYEEFVTGFETAAPGLVDACGLEWEDGCYDFQSVSRAISTFSTVQVREPLSLRTAATRYARHLAPLREALAREQVDMETGAWLGEATD